MKLCAPFVVLLAACVSMPAFQAFPAVAEEASVSVTSVENAWSTPMRYDIEDDRDIHHMSLVTDSQGDPHGVFEDVRLTDSGWVSSLSCFSRHDEETWSFGSIEGTTGATSFSIVMGEDDRLHMGVVLPGGVSYFCRSEAAWWTSELVQAVESDFVSVFLDDAGTVQLYYVDKTVPVLKHARQVGGVAWSVETVDGVASADSLAVDPDGKVHGCNISEDGTLVYFTDAEGEWDFEVVDQDLGEWSSCSIALRSDGVPVLLCCRDYGLSGDVVMALRFDDGWTQMVLAHGAGYQSMAIDKFDNTVLSYISDWTVYFMMTEGGSIAWRALQSENQRGSPTAITTDKDGYVHILYRYSRWYSQTEEPLHKNQLVYATNSLNVPNGPIDLEISKKWNGLELTWSSDGGESYGYEVSGYRVYRGTVEGEELSLKVLGPSELTYLDRDIDPEKTYYYRVTSFNDAGESLFESAVRADTRGWDIEIGLPLSAYLLVVCAAVIAVLSCLLFLQRRSHRMELAKAMAPDQGDIRKEDGK